MKVLSISIAEDMDARLREGATIARRPLSWFVRDLIAEALESHAVATSTVSAITATRKVKRSTDAHHA